MNYFRWIIALEGSTTHSNREVKPNGVDGTTYLLGIAAVFQRESVFLNEDTLPLFSHHGVYRNAIYLDFIIA